MDNITATPRVLSFQLLHEVTNGFSEEMKIGSGSFGNVYKGEHKNGELVAVKILHSISGLDNKEFVKEYQNLASLQHKNIVRLVGYSHETRGEFIRHEGRTILVETIKRALCFEYMQNGNLDGFLADESTGHDWHTRYTIIKGICQGLKYLHEELVPPMSHLDLKPANVLLDENMVPKIADFGLSRLFGGEQSQMTKSAIGTHGYVPPEYIDAGIISIKFDIFSLGVVIIKIITGSKGYFRSAEMSPQQFVELVHGKWKRKLQTTSVHPLEPYSKQVKRCIEIALSCVNADRYKRPSVGEIIDKLNETETAVHLVEASMKNIGSMYEAFNFPSKQVNKQYGTSDNSSVQFAAAHVHNNDEATTTDHTYSDNPWVQFGAAHVHNNDEATTTDHTYSDNPWLQFVAALVHNNDEATTTDHTYSDNPWVQFGAVHVHNNDEATTTDHTYSARQRSRTWRRPPKARVMTAGAVNSPLEGELVSAGDALTFTYGSTWQSDPWVAAPMGTRAEWVGYGSSSSPMDDLSERIVTTHVNGEASLNSGTPIQPGSVQLLIKNNKKAPLFGYEKKVMLELTSGDYTGDRLGLDLVAVVDVGIGVLDKMDHLKTAMRFVVRKLGPRDRLSIVTFSYAAKIVCPLRQITEASQQELEWLISGLTDFGRASNLKDGLLTGLEVLADRKVSSGRVGSIMLMSDGRQSKGDATQVTVGNVRVYTFGIGVDCNPWVLSAIAANSKGGTFSHVQDIGGGGLTMALSQCLAGLFTISVQDLELTVAALGDNARVLNVVAGSYPQAHHGGSVTVKFGDLYSREVRNIIVDLLLPTINSERSADILKVTYSYSTSSSAGTAGRLQFVAPPNTLTVWRTCMKESPLPVELQMEEVRLRAAKMIEEVTTMLWGKIWVQPHEFEAARKKLVQIQNMVWKEQSDPLLKIEVQELLKHVKNEQVGSMFSSVSSHGRQRFAARGSGIEVMRLFATPRMDMYLGQAKKFHKDPKIALPSEQDDVKEEVGALTVNVAGWEEEMRRLSLGMDD